MLLSSALSLSTTPPFEGGVESWSVFLTVTRSETDGRTVTDSRRGVGRSWVWGPLNLWAGEGRADVVELLTARTELLPLGVGVEVVDVLIQEGLRSVTWFLCFSSHLVNESDRFGGEEAVVAASSFSFFSFCRRSTNARFHGGREAK